MGMATLGLAVGMLLAEPISDLLGVERPVARPRRLRRAVGADELRADDGALPRRGAPGRVRVASVANIADHGRGDDRARRRRDKGAIGAVIGNFVGTLAVYVVLLGYRREQLGLEFDRPLLRAMNRFGLPLVPAALMLWAINFIDRFFIAHYDEQARGRHLLAGVRISSVMVFLLRRSARVARVRLLDPRRRRGAADVLLRADVPVSSRAGCRSRSAVLAPWLVELFAPKGLRAPAARRRAARFATAAYSGYSVSRSGSGARGRRSTTGSSPGSRPLVNIALNLILIPRYGMMGAAVATLVAYTCSSSACG